HERHASPRDVDRHRLDLPGAPAVGGAEDHAVIGVGVPADGPARGVLKAGEMPSGGAACSGSAAAGLVIIAAAARISTRSSRACAARRRTRPAAATSAEDLRGGPY